MLNEFAQYLVSLKDNKTYDIHGDTYSDRDLVRIEPHIDRPTSISVSGLDSIVKLVRNEMDMLTNLERIADHCTNIAYSMTNQKNHELQSTIPVEPVAVR